MEFDSRSGELCLRDSRPIRLQRPRGLRVTCTAGTIWITATGVPGDIFLQPGQTHQFAGNGLAIVESIGAGRIRLTKPERFRRLFAVAAEIPRRFGFARKTGYIGLSRLC